MCSVSYHITCCDCASWPSFQYNQLTGTLPPAVDEAVPVSGNSWSYNCISGCSGAYRGCSMPERAALMELFLSTSGFWWTSWSGWLDGNMSPCEWSGVACDVTGTSVV